jgi:hypothetical protein
MMDTVKLKSCQMSRVRIRFIFQNVLTRIAAARAHARQTQALMDLLKIAQMELTTMVMG